MEAKPEPTKTLLFSVLVLCVLSGQVQSVFNIPQCANRRVFPIGSNNQFSMTCTGLGITSNIYWSISSPLTNFTEIRLGECDACYPNCATTNCRVVNSRDYSITRHQSDVTTLTFVDNLEQNQGALIKCSQRDNTSQAFCATYFINATRKAQFQLTECTNGVLEILPTQTVSLTCTALWPVSNIYWSLSGPSTNHTEVRLGQCRSCYPNCSSTPCVVFNDRYAISRPRYDVTMLENTHLNHRDTLKCSQFNNETTAQSSCIIHILKGQVQSVFDIPQCANRRAFPIGSNNQFYMTCTGLGITSNIYWSISSPITNFTEIRLGECDACYPNCATTNCTVVNSRDYAITRHQSDVTTLTFVDNLEQNQGALIKCSQRDNTSQAFCATYFINATRRSQFQLTECTNGVLEILPTQTVSLTCTGLWPLSNIYWSLSGPSTNHTEVRLGQCPSCFPNCSSTPCVVFNDRYAISRPRYDVTVVENAHLNHRDTLTCSKFNNATTAQSSCTIHIRKATEQDSPLPDTFPAAAVGGGVAAAVVVVVIVVVVVVFVKWKRRSNSSESGPQSTGLEPVIYENPVVSSECAAAGEPYDSLRMSDVGLSSEYSAIGDTNTGSQPQAGQPTHYDSLQVSDIGQVSTYSVIGDHKNTSHCAGGDYEIPREAR